MTALAIFAAAAIDGATISVLAAYRLALRRWVPQIVVGFAYLMFLMGLGIVVGLVDRARLACDRGRGADLADRCDRRRRHRRRCARISRSRLRSDCFRWPGRWRRSALQRKIRIRFAPSDADCAGRWCARCCRRTVGAGAAAIAIVWFGTIALLAFGGAAALLTHIDALSVVVAAAGGVVINGLSIIFVMLYMRDVQLRREGTDLLAAVGDLPLPV